MEFCLIYEGSLPSNGNATEKQVIRRQLQPQVEPKRTSGTWGNSVLG